jgi:hypothetical protein
MRISLVMIVVLLAALGYSVGAVAKLENYRYANFVGLCVDGYDVKNPASRIKREDCLMRSETRTSWSWNAAYGLGPSLTVEESRRRRKSLRPIT